MNQLQEEKDKVVNEMHSLKEKINEEYVFRLHELELKA